MSQDYLESLEKSHILLFHEDKENVENVEFNFIKSGLQKNQPCFYTTSEPEEVKQRMKDFGINVEDYIMQKKLSIIKIPKKEEISTKITQK